MKRMVTAMNPRVALMKLRIGSYGTEGRGNAPEDRFDETEGRIRWDEGSWGCNGGSEPMQWRVIRDGTEGHGDCLMRHTW